MTTHQGNIFHKTAKELFSHSSYNSNGKGKNTTFAAIKNYRKNVTDRNKSPLF
jgi:uncharacterized protein YxeA